MESDENVNEADAERVLQTIYHVKIEVPVGQWRACTLLRMDRVMMVVSNLPSSFSFIFASLCNVDDDDELKLKLIQSL
jgi:hypothetical protein